MRAYLIELKNRITNYTKLVELVDINISNYPEILRFGQSKNDCYKTIKEFKKDINVVEIMGVINLAWEYCCQKRKNAFSKQIFIRRKTLIEK